MGCPDRPVFRKGGALFRCPPINRSGGCLGAAVDLHDLLDEVLPFQRSPLPSAASERGTSYRCHTPGRGFAAITPAPPGTTPRQSTTRRSLPPFLNSPASPPRSSKTSSPTRRTPASRSR